MKTENTNQKKNRSSFEISSTKIKFASLKFIKNGRSKTK